MADLIPEDSISFNMGQNIMGYSADEEDGDVHLVSDSGDEIEIGPAAATASLTPGAPIIIGANGIHSTFRNCLATWIKSLARQVSNTRHEPQLWPVNGFCNGGRGHAGTLRSRCQ